MFMILTISLTILSKKVIKKQKKKRIIWIPLLKVFFFSVIVLAFYLIVTNSMQPLVRKLLQSEFNHTNFGGMRRALSPLTLFWGREALFQSQNMTSYINILPSYQISDAISQLNYRSQQFITIQNDLMDSLRTSILNQLSFTEYKKLMFGHTCEFLTIEDCWKTIVAHGVDSGTKLYLFELQNSLKLAENEGFSHENMVLIEHYSKAVENSYVEALSVYSDYVNSVIAEKEQYMIFYAYLFFALVGTYYFFFLLKLTNNITVNLENKIKLLILFNSGKLDYIGKRQTIILPKTNRKQRNSIYL